MENSKKQEVWLRGPLFNVTPLLNPVAHALLQVQEEINDMDPNFPSGLLWKKPAGLASVGFHLQHLAGVLDRLFTYARMETLTDEQLFYLSNEGKQPSPSTSFVDLREVLNKQFLLAMQQLERTDPSTLLDLRDVGRAKIPSTHLGLLVHAAEHTTRHFGQLLVTFKMLLAENNEIN